MKRTDMSLVHRATEIYWVMDISSSPDMMYDGVGLVTKVQLGPAVQVTM